MCGDLDSLLAAVDAERPDVVVTDIRMPPGGTDEGIQAAARLRETNPEVGVVVLSQYATPRYVLALLEGGSARRAYLLKERVNDIEQLAAAIRAVAEGGSVIDPKVVEALVAENARGEESPLSQLTPRERDVLREMAEGKNNAAIAEALVPHRAIGREGDPLDLPQARAHVGDGGPQARQGRDPLPGGERLASSRERERAGDSARSGSSSLPPSASTRSRSPSSPVAEAGVRALPPRRRRPRPPRAPSRSRARRRARAPRDSTSRPPPRPRADSSLRARRRA